MFPEEAKRIRWRQKLMEQPGGVDWLRHVTKLYQGKESLLAPEHIGLPADLRRRLHR